VGTSEGRIRRPCEWSPFLSGGGGEFRCESDEVIACFQNGAHPAFRGNVVRFCLGGARKGDCRNSCASAPDVPMRCENAVCFIFLAQQQGGGSKPVTILNGDVL